MGTMLVNRCDARPRSQLQPCSRLRTNGGDQAATRWCEPPLEAFIALGPGIGALGRSRNGPALIGAARRCDLRWIDAERSLNHGAQPARYGTQGFLEQKLFKRRQRTTGFGVAELRADGDGSDQLRRRKSQWIPLWSDQCVHRTPVSQLKLSERTEPG